MKVEEAAISALKRALGALNTHLASNTFLVGHAVTLADIIMACNLSPGFSYVMTKTFMAEFPHVERYFWTMVNQPNFCKILGEVKQAEKVIPIAPSKKFVQPKEASKSKPKEEPKKEVKKEAEKPKAEAVEEEEAPKPKPKNPLDLLPPSKMILDDWKRLYSNTKTNFREVAIKGIYSFTSIYLPSAVFTFSFHNLQSSFDIPLELYVCRKETCICFFFSILISGFQVTYV